MVLFVTSVHAEQVFGVIFSAEKVTFLVKSSGCTDSNSFKLIKPDLNSKTPIIGIERIKKDHCKAMPSIVEVTYKLSDFGIDKPVDFLKVENAFRTSLY